MTDYKRLSQEQFGLHAANYVNSEGFARGHSLQRLLELTAPQPDWRVLDVATGGGHTARTFAPYVRQVIATDLTGPMLRAARAHLHESLAGPEAVGYAQCDAEQLPFASGVFDLVTCRIAPHHFPMPQRFVEECARVARPGGLVAVVDIITPPEPAAARYLNALDRLRDPSHVWAYSLPEWEGFFRTAGLTVITTEPTSSPQTLGGWAARIGCSEAVTLRLQVMLTQAPDPVREWLAVELPAPGSGEAIRFSVQQVIIVGRK